MTTDTRTMNDLIAVLAAAEVDCHGRKLLGSVIEGHDRCGCQGTGRVPRFQKDGRALFRVPCNDNVEHVVLTGIFMSPFLGPPVEESRRILSCAEAGCHGWRPLPEADLHLEALHWAAQSQGWRLHFDYNAGGNVVVQVRKANRDFVAEAKASLGEEKLGAARVLVAAMEARKDDRVR